MAVARSLIIRINKEYQHNIARRTCPSIILINNNHVYNNVERYRKIIKNTIIYQTIIAQLHREPRRTNLQQAHIHNPTIITNKISHRVKRTINNIKMPAININTIKLLI